MEQYQPQILWELPRAVLSIAAWWLLFYRLHRPEALWRRVALLAVMPSAYALWILMPIPMGIAATIISWGAITVVFAFICGDLRHSLFSTFFFIGQKLSVNFISSALIVLLFNRVFTLYSPEYYLQHNIQGLLTFGVSCFYYAIIKRHSGKFPLAGWIFIVLPPIIHAFILAYFTQVATALLLEQGVNIFGIGFCFAVFCILLNLGILYLYFRQLIITDSQHLTIEVSHAEPVWTQETGLSAAFCQRYELTDREKDIVETMMQGKSNKEIADTLLISIRTVGAYLQNVYKKTEAPNRFALYSLIKGE